jgi:hypothetical protein
MPAAEALLLAVGVLLLLAEEVLPPPLEAVLLAVGVLIELLIALLLFFLAVAMGAKSRTSTAVAANRNMTFLTQYLLYTLRAGHETSLYVSCAIPTVSAPRVNTSVNPSLCLGPILMGAQPSSLVLFLNPECRG